MEELVVSGVTMEVGFSTDSVHIENPISKGSVRLEREIHARSAIFRADERIFTNR